MSAAAQTRRPPARRAGPRAHVQVLFAPNFKCSVARSLHADPAHPGCRFVDLAEISAKEHVF